MSKLTETVDRLLEDDINVTEGFREDLSHFSKLVNRNERTQPGVIRAVGLLASALDNIKQERNSIKSDSPNYRLVESSISTIERVIDVLKSVK